ncbi:PqqD family protein [Falsihalocynthiibacter sp. BN13B15]|uniref:PqqD family protein n=1 Tax=Falsihalocynthiibacter sp. BN13B15 TaxID=3240871 RepID=UPI00350F408B
MTPDSIFEIPVHIVSRLVDGDLVLLDLESGVYFGLDPVGASAWTHISAGVPFSAICLAMEEEYEVEADILEQDIRELLADLEKLNLIEMRQN